MRISCNGCRVLRKGCSDDCTIKPCLHWITSPDSQANATLFLAKFYGRAGLLNLIEAGPSHLRPSVFRSLLFEACGRIVDPVNGSAGMLVSGNWAHCEAAVEAVLKGLPIPPAPVIHPIPPPANNYDIRHVTKDRDSENNVGNTVKTRVRSKRKMISKVKTQNDIGSSTMSTSGSTSVFKFDEAGYEVGLELTLGLGYGPVGGDVLGSGEGAS